MYHFCNLLYIRDKGNIEGITYNNRLVSTKRQYIVYKQNNSVMYKFYCYITHFYTQRMISEKIIGVHDKQLLSVLVAHLLGNAHAERRKYSIRLYIHIQSRNVEYIFWCHKFFAERGYCSPKKPVVKKQIAKKNKIDYSIKFTTFSFSSLNYLYNHFYKIENDSTGKILYRKIVPTNISTLLTTKALAIWIMSNGIKEESGLKISTESFSLQDNVLLQQALYEKYSIKPSIQRDKNKSFLYFTNSDIYVLYTLIKPDILPCMYYKFTLKK